MGTCPLVPRGKSGPGSSSSNRQKESAPKPRKWRGNFCTQRKAINRLEHATSESQHAAAAASKRLHAATKFLEGPPLFIGRAAAADDAASVQMVW